MPPVRVGELAGKRFFGYLSWTRRRRHVHRPEVLEALARDLVETAPDHIAVTGDLTNIALPGEFETALAWLGTLGPPERVSVVPGNHDAYVAMPWARALGRWAAFMADESAGAPGGREDFPFLRRYGEVAILGLSTALPTALFLASGRLGQAQLDRLSARLEALGREGLCRVVLLHHPPDQTGISRRKHLTDAAGFRQVVAAQGAELVLHGHDHSFWTSRLPAGAGEAQVFGVPSASAVRGAGRHPVAHYLLYAIRRDGEAWRIEATARRYDAASGRFAAAPLPGVAQR